MGAARLARLAVVGDDPMKLCTPPRRLEILEPDLGKSHACAERLEAYRKAYSRPTD